MKITNNTMYQELLIREIQKKTGRHQSLIAEVSAALDISYDAAHRRISMKSKFSIEETVLLANYFGFSMDQVFQRGEHVLVKRTKEIQTLNDFSSYLDNSLKSLMDYLPGTETSLYYSAKDIPIFYTINTDLLSTFKRYVWLNMLNMEGLDISFETFEKNARIMDNSRKLNHFYSAISAHEIWNDTTINSTLQQIMYFFHAGLLTADNGKSLCENLKELIFSLEKKCTAQNEQYRLYYHDLLILNNNVLVADKQRKSLFVPYTMLGYFITSDTDTCKHVSNFFQHQLKNSKLLNTAGTRDKKMFFNRAYQKIDLYKNQITSFNDIG
ncbi:hypothetical protein ACR78F_00780 [Sphingobacterium spiritivorum]|uniref:hypothetical protein n=1 Tax=Sphingobacterium spiritivorum TaxID=258 RepID=UPI003DA5AC71